MTGTHRKPCEKCGGSGLIPRWTPPESEQSPTRRYLDNMPFAGKETCDRCGGSGEQSYTPAGVVESGATPATVFP